MVLCALLAAATVAASPAAPRVDAALQKKLEDMASAHAGKVSFYAKDLTTGRTVALAADRPMRSASVIKLTVLLAAMEQVKAGRLSLSQPVVLDSGNVVSGSGVLWFMQPGLSLKLEDVLSLMIIVSDNTATNLAVQVVGLDAVNAVPRRLGLSNTRMFRKVGKFPQVPDQNEKDFGLGKLSARDAAALLESIERCDLHDQRLCNKMLQLLVEQQYRTGAPRYLETDDEERHAIADKPGQLDQTRNDAALVYSAAGPLVVSVFTSENRDTRWTCENEAEVLIGRMTKALVDAWSPKGLRPGGPPQLEAGLPGRR